jgi:hypothetical protein
MDLTSMKNFLGRPDGKHARRVRNEANNTITMRNDLQKAIKYVMTFATMYHAFRPLFKTQ